jgi:hypothetical protein
LEEDQLGSEQRDTEESAADRFALELLTGDAQPTVMPASSASSSRELARVALASAGDLGIEPGMLALCFGWSTRKWRIANGAMRHIYATAKPVWREVNGIAHRELDFSSLPDDARDYLDAILGTSDR